MQLVLNFKIDQEEKALVQKFGEVYEEYQKKVSKGFPFS